MKIKNEKLNSVRNRLFLTISGIIIVIILVLLLTNSVVLESFYMYKKIYAVDRVYKDINKMYNDNINDIEGKIEKIAIQNNIDILIKEGNTVTVYSTDKNLENEIANPEDMLVYYTKEKIKNYGVMGIKIRKKK